ncbi:MAG: sugar phosphate nucleotidyltransferase [Candidatus Binataceae bacterium]
MEQTLSCGEQERATVILAGGEGSRLRSLTRRIMGRHVPKQFCPVLGKETLLEQTLRRASLSVEARAISVIVTRSHEPFYSPLARDLPARNLVVQPQNRRTAPAILYSLLRLAELAPRAQVAIFPSDHFVNDDREFMRHVDMAFAAVRSRPELTVLLGIQPDSPETGYGWIEPAVGVRDTSAFMVHRFWEKPPPELAEELLVRGCLWNSFVMVGQLSTLLGLFMIALPNLYLSFKKIQTIFGTTFEEKTVERLYSDLGNASFSDEVLARHPVNLAVLPVRGVEWSDLGEPRRVMDTCARIGLRPQWAAA